MERRALPGVILATILSSSRRKKKSLAYYTSFDLQRWTSISHASLPIGFEFVITFMRTLSSG